MTITNPIIQQQGEIRLDNPQARIGLADSRMPLTAAAFQRMEETINPQEPSEEYILHGKGACKHFHFPFRIQPFLVELIRALGGPRLESISASGGAANYIVTRLCTIS